MVDIDFSQYRMLFRVKYFGPIQIDSLSAKEESICDFLLEHSFIDLQTKMSIEKISTGEYPVMRPVSFVITQSGRAQMASYISAFHKWWISVAISISALLISLLK